MFFSCLGCLCFFLFDFFSLVWVFVFLCFFLFGVGIRLVLKCEVFGLISFV